MREPDVINEVEIAGAEGTIYAVRTLEDGTLEIHGRGRYPALWIAPSSGANVVTIVPVDIFASRDRRPLVRSERITTLLGLIRRGVEEARGRVLRGDVDDAMRRLREAHQSAKELDDLIR